MRKTRIPMAVLTCLLAATFTTACLLGSLSLGFAQEKEEKRGGNPRGRERGEQSAQQAPANAPAAAPSRPAPPAGGGASGASENRQRGGSQESGAGRLGGSRMGASDGSLPAGRQSLGAGERGAGSRGGDRQVESSGRGSEMQGGRSQGSTSGDRQGGVQGGPAGDRQGAGRGSEMQGGRSQGSTSGDRQGGVQGGPAGDRQGAGRGSEMQGGRSQGSTSGDRQGGVQGGPAGDRQGAGRGSEMQGGRSQGSTSGDRQGGVQGGPAGDRQGAGRGSEMQGGRSQGSSSGDRQGGVQGGPAGDRQGAGRGSEMQGGRSQGSSSGDRQGGVQGGPAGDRQGAGRSSEMQGGRSQGSSSGDRQGGFQGGPSGDRQGAGRGSEMQGGRSQGGPAGERQGSGGSRRSSGQFTRRSNGTPESYRGANNTEARFRSDGSLSEIRRPGMTVTRNSFGAKRVYAERPDHTIIVSHAPGYGYAQRGFSVRDQSFVQRTYVYNHRVYANVYRPYSFGGFTIHAYAPMRYYAPAFYGWTYSTWGSPVRYRWGWSSSPWYGYYGGWFTPYPAYTSPILWLTDFFVSATLEAAYEERMAQRSRADIAMASYDYGGGSLAPDVKQAIADEVQRQIELERAEADGNLPFSPNGLPPSLAGNRHTFVVVRGMDVSSLTAGGAGCLLTEGDVLLMDRPLPPNASAATVWVLASKGRECRKGDMVQVPIRDLLEMQNRMREDIDRGMQELRARQGRDGLPRLPSQADRAPVDAPYASAAPPPDDDAASAVNEQIQQANQVEQEIASEAGSAPAGASPDNPGTITLDQTFDQVVAILGQPRQIVDLGAKKIYIYKDVKVTFQNGRVSDVQ